MIEFKNVTATLNSPVHPAVDQVSFQIQKGSICGVVGAGGSGKTALLQLMAGSLQPDSGEILVEGKQPGKDASVRNRIICFRDNLSFPGTTKMDNVADIYASIYPAFDFQKYRYLTDFFSLDTKKPYDQLPLSMCRLGFLVLSLASRPDYLFLDEILSGLDRGTCQLVKRFLCEEALERKATIVLTSHSLASLKDACDQLILLENGKLIYNSDDRDSKMPYFRIQTAFRDGENYKKEDFGPMDIRQMVRHGSVLEFIVCGKKKEIVSAFQKKNPLFLDVFPLSLEDVFNYEVNY